MRGERSMWRGMGFRTGLAAAGLGLALAAGTARAGEANVLDVTLEREPGGTWRVSATVQHADEGWEHYANRWDVLAPDGTVLGTRELEHPHVDEQPFTRSLTGVAIPEEVDRITVRAHDSVHGFGGAEASAAVPDRGEAR